MSKATYYACKVEWLGKIHRAHYVMTHSLGVVGRRYTEPADSVYQTPASYVLILEDDSNQALLVYIAIATACSYIGAVVLSNWLVSAWWCKQPSSNSSPVTIKAAWIV